MKPVTLFYQPRCPFCKKALGYLEELQRQEPYGRIEIRMIDELAEPEVADRYDYYYVPTFYVGDKKVHEGGIMRRGGGRTPYGPRRAIGGKPFLRKKE